MKEKKKADGCAPSAQAEAGNPLPPLNPKYTPIRPSCQGAHPSPLVRQAQQKATQAQAMAQACREAGDRDGWWIWRRQMLRHQAIFWTASHRPEVRP